MQPFRAKNLWNDAIVYGTVIWDKNIGYSFITRIDEWIDYDIQNNRLWHEEPVYVDVEWSTLEIYMNGTWILYQLPLSEEYYG